MASGDATGSVVGGSPGLFRGGLTPVGGRQLPSTFSSQSRSASSFQPAVLEGAMAGKNDQRWSAWSQKAASTASSLGGLGGAQAGAVAARQSLPRAVPASP